MTTQLEAQHIIPQELGFVRTETADASSFTEALQVIESNETGVRELDLEFPYKLNEDDKNSLKLLPNAFSLNTVIQKLTFVSAQVDDILVAEALKAGIKKDEVTYIEFWDFDQRRNQRLIGIMCEGLKERSTAFQLKLSLSSSESVKPILEASHLKCFSLMLDRMDCTQIRRSVKTCLVRASLYYITLLDVKGLKDVFLLLGRCLLPNLAKLDLMRSVVPTSALKRLHGSLKTILNSGRSNLFEKLDLGKTQVGRRLCFAYFKLLGSDLFGEFKLVVKEDMPRAVVKSVSSTVAKTKNLRILRTGNKFSSGTKFKNFKLQKETHYYAGSAFGVNPTSA